MVKEQNYCIEAFPTNWVSIANKIVLADFGHFPLQAHFLEQILHCHRRTVELNTRLVKHAVISVL